MYKNNSQNSFRYFTKLTVENLYCLEVLINLPNRPLCIAKLSETKVGFDEIS